MTSLRKTSFLALFFALLPLLGWTQNSASRDFFESNNKIYVVILVLASILIGIFIVLFYLERKIKKLENK